MEIGKGVSWHTLSGQSGDLSDVLNAERVDDHAGSGTSNVSNVRVLDRFHARDLHLVMGSSMDGQPVRTRVHIDGMPPAAAHGTDIDADGAGIVSEYRIHHLFRQGPSDEDREVEILFSIGPWSSSLSASAEPHVRSDWNPVRNSSVKISGCSHAAKCPPFATRL